MTVWTRRAQAVHRRRHRAVQGGSRRLGKEMRRGRVVRTVTSISGSGPAYIFIKPVDAEAQEAYSRGRNNFGASDHPRFCETPWSGEHPAVLKNPSPRPGTTETPRARRKLQNGRPDAMWACYRSLEMGGGTDVRTGCSAGRNQPQGPGHSQQQHGLWVSDQNCFFLRVPLLQGLAFALTQPRAAPGT